MKRKNYTGFLLALLIITVAGSCERPRVSVEDLRTEYLANPLQIDVQAPALSWKLEAAQPDQRNIRQQAYQVVVASSRKLLRKDKGDLWNSGKIVSSASNLVPYAGKELQSRQTCYWKVRVWDQDGKASPWSPVSTWKMALLSKSDWEGANWIGMKEDSLAAPLNERSFQTFTMKSPVMKRSYPSPLLRKQITLKKKIRNATMYLAGLGYSELYVNGVKSGDAVLDPAQTNYDVCSLYVTHDITPLLKKGSNVLGVMLGNGFYGQGIGFVDWLVYGTPRMIGKIWITYVDGSEEVISTGTDWKVIAGPVQFNNVYGGESFDARAEKAGWTLPGYDDSSWSQAIVLPTPTDSLRSQMIPPIRKMQTLKPVSAIRGDSGKWIFDLGQNIAGWVRITVREKAGQEIVMRFAENLKPGGKSLDFASLGPQHTGMIQTNIYVCKGKGPETWEPRFTYAGFRYVEVSGLTEKPGDETLLGVAVHSSVQKRGNFACSDSVMNRIYTTSLWTILDNLHSIPEDCPAREKCGWLGDAHGTAETDLYNYDMALFFRKYMEDIRGQLGRGGETHFKETATPGIPANISTGKRVCQEARVDWAVAEVLIPYYLYEYNGDIRVFREFYPHMKDLVNYIIRYEDTNGIIQNGYGDWCPPGSNDKMECPPELTSTAFFYRILDILGSMAVQLNDPAFAEWCRQKKDKVKDNFNKAYLKPVEGTDLLTYGSQTGIVAAWRAGLVPEDRQGRVLGGLQHDINVRHGGHMSTGIHGQRIYSVLCENGMDDLAYRIMTNPTFPSLAYSLSCDLTTWPEEPMEYKDTSVRRTASFNHPMHAGFAAFFHECIGGIRPSPDAPGFSQFIIKPGLTSVLAWANTDFESAYGKIVSNWKSDKGEFTLDVRIPCNTGATVYIPSARAEDVTESGKPIASLSGTGSATCQNGYTRLELGSGVYHFVAHKP